MSDPERTLTDAEIQQAFTAASAAGMIALQGILQLGASLREDGLPPERLELAAAYMQDMLRQMEREIPDPRFRYFLPKIRGLLDRWTLGE